MVNIHHRTHHVSFMQEQSWVSITVLSVATIWKDLINVAKGNSITLAKLEIQVIDVSYQTLNTFRSSRWVPYTWYIRTSGLSLYSCTVPTFDMIFSNEWSNIEYPYLLTIPGWSRNIPTVAVVWQSHSYLCIIFMLILCSEYNGDANREFPCLIQ